MSERARNAWKWIKWLGPTAVLIAAGVVLWQFRPVAPPDWSTRTPRAPVAGATTQFSAAEGLAEHSDLWRHTAVALHVESALIGEVDGYLKEAFTHSELKDKKVFTGAQSAELRISIHNFIDSHMWLFQDRKKRGQTGRWLAYCMAEAATRPVTPETEPLPDDYQREIKSLAEQFKRRLADKSPPGGENIPLMDSAVRRFSACMDESIRRYRSDVLCPAFRRPVNDEARAAMRKRLNEYIRQYVDGEPSSRAQRAEYARWLNDTADKYAGGCLYDIFTAEIKPEITQNKFWAGPTSWSSEGGSSVSRNEPLLVWPAYVGFQPARLQQAENDPTTRQGEDGF